MLISGGGSPIKSLQKGEKAFSGTGTLHTVTISEVDPDKCLVYMTWRQASTTFCIWATRLIDSTTFEFRRDATSPSVNFNLHWEVIEYA